MFCRIVYEYGVFSAARVVKLNGMRKTAGQKTEKRKAPEAYIQREYRQRVTTGGLVSSYVRIEETDLHIMATGDVNRRATELVLQYRLQLEGYIRKNPQFASSLVPLPVDNLAPQLVQEMQVAGQKAGVGPMAAVAGTVAEYVGKSLLAEGTAEVIIENGGDIFLARSIDSTVAIFAGKSPLSYTVGIRIRQENMPCGVCTSSGTVGHSLSFGDADSVTVLAESAALADAAATRLGNEVGSGRGGKGGVDRALAQAGKIEGILGVVVVCNELIGAVGDVELIGLK